MKDSDGHETDLKASPLLFVMGRLVTSVQTNEVGKVVSLRKSPPLCLARIDTDTTPPTEQWFVDLKEPQQYASDNDEEVSLV